MADRTDGHHSDFIRQSQMPYGNTFCSFSSDQTTINFLRENQQSVLDLSMKCVYFDADGEPYFYQNALEIKPNDQKEKCKTKADLGSDSWASHLRKIAVKLGLEQRMDFIRGYCSSDNCTVCSRSFFRFFLTVSIFYFFFHFFNLFTVFVSNTFLLFHPSLPKSILRSTSIKRRHWGVPPSVLKHVVL